jgi:choline dehydrogenase-like flavoprotein
LGHQPFRLPLAINYAASSARNACIRCSTCDCYPCAVAAKNDVASALLPALLANGLELVTGTAAVRIRVSGHRATGVDCVHTATGAPVHYSARHVIAAAGALATPHLLLASGLAQQHASGKLIGRTLMRHVNAVVFGVFPNRLDPAREFHKEIGINDFYFGHPSISEPHGKLGTIQQVHCPPPGLVRTGLPRPMGDAGTKILGHMTGFIVIANDQPQAANRVELMQATNQLGSPAARVHHRYSARDRAARAALVRVAKTVLSEAGALLTFSLPVRTFSHAMGTVRMGREELHAPLDADGRLRGVNNVLVADASVLPTSGGVNPSLTIAATALHTGCRLAGVSLGGSFERPVSITSRKELLNV